MLRAWIIAEPLSMQQFYTWKDFHEYPLWGSIPKGKAMSNPHQGQRIMELAFFGFPENLWIFWKPVRWSRDILRKTRGSAGLGMAIRKLHCGRNGRNNIDIPAWNLIKVQIPSSYYLILKRHTAMKWIWFFPSWNMLVVDEVTGIIWAMLEALKMLIRLRMD